MRIFADHCVNRDVVSVLRDLRFTVTTALDVGLQRAPDEQIFNYALRKKQILLTFDKDFGNIARFNILESPGAVIVYIERMDKEAIVKNTLRFFKAYRKHRSKLAGKLFLVEPSMVRIWPPQ